MSDERRDDIDAFKSKQVFEAAERLTKPTVNVVVMGTLQGNSQIMPRTPKVIGGRLGVGETGGKGSGQTCFVIFTPLMSTLPPRDRHTCTTGLLSPGRKVGS